MEKEQKISQMSWFFFWASAFGSLSYQDDDDDDEDDDDGDDGDEAVVGKVVFE